MLVLDAFFCGWCICLCHSVLLLPKFFARLGEKLRTSRSNSPNVAEYYSKRHGVTLRNTRSFTPNSMEQHSERWGGATEKGPKT